MAYCDLLGTEIKVGHIIAVGRYSRGSGLDVGIVTKITHTKKSTWVYFGYMRWYKSWQATTPAWHQAESKAQLQGGINSNISIVHVDVNQMNEQKLKGFQEQRKSMIADGILPSSYQLGKPVSESEEDEIDLTIEMANISKQAKQPKAIEDILSDLGTPESLRKK